WVVGLHAHCTPADRGCGVPGVGGHGSVPRAEHLALRRGEPARDDRSVVPGRRGPSHQNETVPLRHLVRSLGSEGEVTDDRPAFYALPTGGWRDWWTLLHPPYTLWHLSYVAIGAAVAPALNLHWLGETLAAFFLALGLAAHALDELRGRPLRTS